MNESTEIVTLSPLDVRPSPGRNVSPPRPTAEADRRSAMEDALGAFLLAVVPQQDPVSAQIVMDFAKQQITNSILFAKKQFDYGPENVSLIGERGLFHRATEKWARLRNVVRRGRALNESVEDSWGDLSVLSSMAQMVRAGRWPGTNPLDALIVDDKA